LRHLNPDERRLQAEFLLHFLAFAKRHGKPALDGSAWDAAPAICAIVRKWPGCSHMNYKTRIDHAVTAGMLTLVKDKWQNPSGKGRARTYRIYVPVPVPGSETLDHSTALARLSEGTRLDGRVEEEGTTTPNPRPLPGESGDAVSRNETCFGPNHSPALPEEGSGGRLGTSPRKCNPQRNAADRLPRVRPGHCGADHDRGCIEYCRQDSADDLTTRERERLSDSMPISSLVTVLCCDGAKVWHLHPPNANSPSPK
jgi:hypothetical protein